MGQGSTERHRARRSIGGAKVTVRAAALLLVCTAACPPEAGPAPGPGETAWRGVAEAMCEVRVRCEATWARLTIDECLDVVDAAYGWRDEGRRVDALVQEGRLLLDEEAARACAAGIENAPCGPMDELHAALFAVPACGRLVSGKVKPGEACHAVPVFLMPLLVSMCEGGWCDDTSQCPGTCEAYLPRGASCGIGEGLCDLTTDECDHDGSETCVALLEAGGTCTDDHDCEFGLVCGGREDETTCMARKPDGEYCASMKECLSGLCVVTFVDDVPLDDGTCASVLPEGWPCSHESHCPEGTRCVGDGYLRFCEPAGSTAEGGACGADTDCRRDLLCVDGSCRPVSLPGEACGYVCETGCEPSSGVCAGFSFVGCTEEGWREGF